MALPPVLCPECGAARPRRAAGCPRCGHIFQDVPAAEAGLAPHPVARANPTEPHPEDARAERGAGCSSCLLLAGIVTGLTLCAALALWLLARAELVELMGSFQREQARSDLARLAGALETWAEDHERRLPPDLAALELPADALRDPWDELYRYEPAADGRSARLLSLGADSAPGGEGRDADLERLVTLP